MAQPELVPIRTENSEFCSFFCRSDIIWLSITATMNGKDCPTSWLSRIAGWFRSIGAAEWAAALERGARKENRHIQAICFVGIINDFASSGPQGKNILRACKQLRDWLGILSREGKVQIKPFGDGQERLWMIGYVQKDHGQDGYRLLSHGISDDEEGEHRLSLFSVAGWR
eukprot:COSAG01_NODE_16634_length_1218_cov_68.917784_2_plen_170_part_00